MEFRGRDGDAIATTIFSYQTTEQLSKGDGAPLVEEGCCGHLVRSTVVNLADDSSVSVGG